MRNKLNRFHFVGIGGIGMAALAELLHAQGNRVTGSDLRATAVTDHLANLGVHVSIGHAARTIGDARVVVRSSAIPFDNAEIAAAGEAGVPVISRGELLAEIMRTRSGIAIGGSHGKTTTSALVAHVLRSAGLDPTALIGGRVPRSDGTASPTHVGGDDLLVAEVDESDGSFLMTRPVVAVITNADPEHLDHYGTRKSLLDAFVQFANSVPFWSAAILGIDHPGVAEIAPRIRARQVRFGFHEGADLRALGAETRGTGQLCHAALATGEEFEFSIPLPGEHNIQNALAAIATALEFDLSVASIAKAIETFPGVGRRFERKGESAGIQVVDDYAHHPAELTAALRGARSLHKGRIVAIFQPHRYTRTRDCWDDFLGCFLDADVVVLSDVYAASETPIEGFDSAALAKAIARAGHADVRHGGDLASIENALPNTLEPGDLVLTLGAGDVSDLGPKLLAALARRAEGGA